MEGDQEKEQQQQQQQPHQEEEEQEEEEEEGPWMGVKFRICCMTALLRIALAYELLHPGAVNRIHEDLIVFKEDEPEQCKKFIEEYNPNLKFSDDKSPNLHVHPGSFCPNKDAAQKTKDEKKDEQFLTEIRFPLICVTKLLRIALIYEFHHPGTIQEVHVDRILFRGNEAARCNDFLVNCYPDMKINSDETPPSENQ